MSPLPFSRCHDYASSKRSPLSNPADTPRPVEDAVCRPQGAPEAMLLTTPAECRQPGPGNKEPTSTQRTSSDCDPPGGTGSMTVGGKVGGEPELAEGASCTLWGGHPAGRRSCTVSPSFQDKHDPTLAPPGEGQGAHRTALSTPAARPEHAGPPPLLHPLSAASPPVSLLTSCPGVCRSQSPLGSLSASLTSWSWPQGGPHMESSRARC